MSSSTFYEKLASLACLIFYVQLVSTTPCFASSTEAEALLKWKASIQNQTLDNLSTWTYFPRKNATNFLRKPKANASPCKTWTGISCNAAGSIININLTTSGIQGTLHEFSFLSFPNLEYLDLSMNKLFDVIPPQISYLSKLVYLDLACNELFGRIPPEIGGLRNLTILYLFANKLSGEIPKEIGNLKSLVDLKLSVNSLTGSIPPSFGSLKKLTTLCLSKNKLSVVLFLKRWGT